jgi:hypothetical protein
MKPASHLWIEALAMVLVSLIPVAAQQTDPPSAVVFQDFDTPSGTSFVLTQHLNPSPPFLAGDPEECFLRLTDSGRNQVNSIAFDLAAQGGYRRIVADFDFRLIPEFFRNRSDGFSFALLNTAVFGSQGPPPLFFSEEPSLSHSFGIGFDIYANRGSWFLPEFPDPMHYFNDPDNNHLSLHFNGRMVKAFSLDPAIFDLANGRFNHARLELVGQNEGTFVTLDLTSFSGETIAPIAGFLIPGMQPYEGRVLFSARLGNAGADQDLDNVRVEFYDPVPATEPPPDPPSPEITIGSTLAGPDTLIPGRIVEIPVRLDFSGTGDRLGAFSAFAVWDGSLLSLVGVTAGTFSDTVFANDNPWHNDQGQEFINFDGFNPAGAEDQVELARLVFRVVGTPGATGRLTVDFPELISTEATAFRDLSPHVAAATKDLAIMTSSLRGDVDNDGQVTLRDAQLVAAFAVREFAYLPPDMQIGLSGDVDEDGVVAIRDALLIAAEAARALRDEPLAGETEDETLLRLASQEPGAQVRLVFTPGPATTAYQILLTWDSTELALSQVKAGSMQTVSQEGSLQLSALGLKEATPIYVDFSLLRPAGTALLRCRSEAISTDFTTRSLIPQVQALGPTAVLESSPEVSAFSLAASFPNPFNAATAIRYVLPEGAPVILTVYDLQGQRIRELVRQFQTAGSYQVTWDGRNEQGQPAGSGTYFYCLQAGRFAQTRKMALVR